MSTNTWTVREEHLTEEAWVLGLDGLKAHADNGHPKAIPTDPMDALAAAMIGWFMGAWALESGAPIPSPSIEFTLEFSRRAQYTMLCMLDWPEWWPVSIEDMREAFARAWYP